MLDERVRSGKQPADAAVITPAHEVWRTTAFPEHLQDLPVPYPVAQAMSSDDQTISNSSAPDARLDGRRGHVILLSVGHE
jgi:hypothetical protein